MRAANEGVHVHGMRMLDRATALAAVLAAATLVAAGCGGGSTPPATTHAARTTKVDPAVRARLMRDGARVFDRHCATCHPLLGKPNKRYHSDALALNLDEVRPEPQYTNARLIGGGVGMGSFQSVLSPRAMRAVYTYVMAVSGRKVVVPRNPPPTLLATGEHVFTDHCQRCHGIAGRRSTGKIGIWLPTDLNVVKPSVAYVERLVRSGEQDAMPSFRHRLTAAEIRAVAIYTTVTAGPRAASGAHDR
jgi:mono/diheme cytochrome c family protein